MPATLYGFGPEFDSVQIAGDPAGRLITLGPGQGPFTIGDPVPVGLDDILGQLGVVTDEDGASVAPVSRVPQRVGNGHSVTRTGWDIDANAIRLGAFNSLPAGTYTKVRFWVDTSVATNASTRAPRVRAALYSGARALVAQTKQTGLGRNLLDNPSVDSNANNIGGNGTSTFGDRVTRTNEVGGALGTSFAVKVVATDPTDGFAMSGDNLRNADNLLLQGDIYNLSAYMRGLNGGEFVLIQAREGSSTGALLAATQSAKIQLTADFQRYDWTAVVTNAATTRLTMKVLPANPGVSAGSPEVYYTDQMQQTLGPELWPYTNAHQPGSWKTLSLTAPLVVPSTTSYWIGLHSGTDKTARVEAGTQAFAPQLNEAINPSLTNDAGSWTTWANGPANATISGNGRVTTDAYMGGSCYETTITPITGSAYQQIIFQNPNSAYGNVPVSPGQTVLARIAVKIVSGTIPAGFRWALGLRGWAPDGTTAVYQATNLSLTSAPVLGEWNLLEGTATIPAGWGYLFGIDATASGSVITDASTIRADMAQFTINPVAPVPLISGDLPGGSWEGATGASKSRGLGLRVNAIPDPRCVTIGAWSVANGQVKITADASAPTGSSLEIFTPTSNDNFSTPTSSVSGRSGGAISDNLFAVAPGETWSLSGWVKCNADALAAKNAGSNTSAKSSNATLWYKVTGSNSYVQLGTKGALAPTVADTWTPFSLVVTWPALTRWVFLRLYNATAAAATIPAGDPRTWYSGLKLERGTEPAGGYWSGENSNGMWLGAADASVSVLNDRLTEIADLYSDGTVATLPTSIGAFPVTTPAVQLAS